MTRLSRWLTVALLVPAGGLCGTVPGRASAPARREPQLTSAAALGKRIFFDRSLSASGRMACATCHDPAYAYGPPNAFAVQYGGPELKTPGFRAVPSLRYILPRVPVWTHVRATNPIEQLTEPDEAPAGGYTWDGRLNSLQAQALFPFFSREEMDNRNVAELAEKLSRAEYAADFRALFGK